MCGASVIASTAVIGATSFAGNVVGQGISKGFNKINYGEALTSTGTDLLSFGMARKFGPAVKAFGSKVVSKVTNTQTFNKISSRVTTMLGRTPSFKTGADGEKFLGKLVGGSRQVPFDTSQGKRITDQLSKKIAHESKVGYTTLTKRIRTQVEKDVELIW